MEKEWPEMGSVAFFFCYYSSLLWSRLFAGGESREEEEIIKVEGERGRRGGGKKGDDADSFSAALWTLPPRKAGSTAAKEKSYTSHFRPFFLHSISLKEQNLLQAVQ